MTSRALSLALVIAAVPAALVSCAEPPPPPATPPVVETPKPKEPPAPAPSASVAPEASASAAPLPKKPEGAQPAPVLTYTGAFATPESVTWDETNDRYLVSNINGKPLDVDNNGYISELSPDGTVKTAKLVAGGVNKVTLNAPKGMAISAGVLYVADISVVRTFDAKTFAPKADIAIPGATFLNDVAAGPDGKIYVSDSGLKQGEKDFEPTGSDAVYVIEKGKAKPVAKSTDLGRPNGLLVDGKTLYVVTFGSGELYTLDAKGKKTDAAKLGQGALDGIVLLGDGSLLVSSWAGSEVLKGKAKSPFAAVVTGAKAPADIGYDKKRGRLLVPRFLEDKVEVFEVK